MSRKCYNLETRMLEILVRHVTYEKSILFCGEKGLYLIENTCRGMVY